MNRVFKILRAIGVVLGLSLIIRGTSDHPLVSSEIDPRGSRTTIVKEDPGALFAALTRIKTTREGYTYPPGYLTKELRKAESGLSRSRKQASDLDWKERGPVNISGRARAIVADPSDASKNTWWQASIGGGVWKTTDAGATWENKTPDLLTLTTATITICASNPNVMYVGTGMGYGRIVDQAGSGIWKSIDHGETWVQLESTANGELLDAVNRIIVDPDNENIVLACTNGFASHLGSKSGTNAPYGQGRKSGIFRSENGGDTWTKVFDADDLDPSRDNRVQQIIADPTDFNILYASVNELGVVKSTDKGVTWSLTSGQFTRANHVGVVQGNGFGLAGISSRSELAIAPSDPSRIYAAVERPNSEPADLYMSKDAGLNWVDVVDTGNDPSWFGTNGGLDRNAGWFDNTIAVHPFDPDVVYVGGVNIYQLNINATSNTRSSTPIAWWIPNNTGIPVVHADHHWLEIFVTDESAQSFTILDANDGGYSASTDAGASWTQFGGTVTTQFYAVDKKPGENVYIGGLQDNSTLVSGIDPNNQSTWTTVIGGDGVEVVWNYNNPNEVLACSQGGNLSKSYDGGQSFIGINQARANFQNAPFLTKIANSKSDPDLVFVVGDGGVNRSDDFGETWAKTSVPGPWLGFRPFDNVEVSLADPRVVWISSRLDNDPAAGIPGGIYGSVDGGLTFTDLSSTFPDNVTESSGIATHPDDGGTAYFLFSEPGNPKILKTIDFGQTWEDISGFSDDASGRFNDRGFPDVAVFSLLVMPFDDKVIWAGTEIGLFITEDGGDSWFLSDNGLPNVGIFQMSIVDEQILLATLGRGVWTVELPELQGHLPKDVPLVPRVGDLAMMTSGDYLITLDLRSPYDSTELKVDGEILTKFQSTTENTSIVRTFTPQEDKAISVQIVSYVKGEPFVSGAKSLNVFTTTPAKEFVTAFEKQEEINQLILTNFSVSTVAGFNSSAAHSAHPYSNASNAIILLKTPIIIDDEDALIEYKDIALVEPGANSVTDHTDPNFFDFVIIEGSNDGLTWKAMTPGYDARANANWLNTFNSAIVGQNSTASGSASLFAQQSINIHETFAARDTIFLRFRLFSDPLAFGWGWVIDDLRIQSPEDNSGGGEVTSVTNTELESFIVYPNPFLDHFDLSYEVVNPGDLSISIINMEGKRVDEMGVHVGAEKEALTYNGAHLQKGLYLLKIEGRDVTRTMKIVKQ